MEFKDELLRKAKIPIAMALRFALRLRYVHLDGVLQQRRLRGYVHDIQSVSRISQRTSGRFCIFVFYEPDGAVPASVQRALNALREHDVNVLLVSNHRLSDAQVAIFSKTCHFLITRGNTGFDFGAYKDAVLWLYKQGWDIQRLALMNDSVFYGSQGLSGFVADLFADEDVVAAFENCGEQYHLNSYALSMSRDVLHSDPVERFWRGYVPVSNRIYAIGQGEAKLSKALLEAATGKSVVYAPAELERQLEGASLPPDHVLPHLPPLWHKRLQPPAPGAPIEPKKIIKVITLASQIHSGAYYFPKYMGCPLFKKDLVYRLWFPLEAVQGWIEELLPPVEAQEFLSTLRRRGTAKELPFWQRWKAYIGVR